MVAHMAQLVEHMIVNDQSECSGSDPTSWLLIPDGIHLIRIEANLSLFAQR